MTAILEILLFIICFVIVNSFVLYPIVILFIGSTKENSIRQEEIGPTISVLVAAYNEEKVIRERIKNLASQEYDLSKVEVYVGSDNSTDDTNNILLELQKEYSWLKIFLFETRKGKAGILNELITKVNNEILVFTDANTEFKKDTLKNLVQDFIDPKVGGVCGRLVLEENEFARREGVEETKYWKYETFIKRSEGECGISFAANGGIFAIRKNLYKNIPVDKAVTDDLFMSLSVIAQGYKFTYREDAVAYEETGKNISAEYKRKVRFSATNFQTLANFKELLCGKSLLLGYAFFSHKVTRWFLPLLLILAFVLSVSLYNSNSFIFVLLSMQIVFYIFALIGFVLSNLKIENPFFSIPYFFILQNVAVAAGFIKFMKKEHSVIWTSTER